MYCKKCGAELPDQALVCGKCGTPVKPYDSAGQKIREQENGGGQEENTPRNFRPHQDENPYSYDRPSRQSSRERQEYSGNQFSGMEKEKTGNEGYASVSLILSIVSIVVCAFPYLTIPLSLAAIAFGVMGRKSSRRTRATVGIVIGVIMLMTGMVLMICMAALAPYEDELANLFYGYMEQLR